MEKKSPPSLSRLSGIVLLLLLLLPLVPPSRAEDISSVDRAIGIAKSDFEKFYLDRPNLVRLGIGVAGAGLAANTNLDRYIRDKYQEDLRSDRTDRVADIAKVFGEGLFAVPFYAGTYAAGFFLQNPAMEDWAQRSFRATAVGLPAVLFLQSAIGSSRPSDGDSDWKPFHESHGVSGHAFIGGIPFITAAKMSGNPYVKGLLYGLSVFPGLSRINDDEHYFSQAALGWYIAYLSCDAALKTDKDREGKIDIAFVPVEGGFAVALHGNF